MGAAQGFNREGPVAVPPQSIPWMHVASAAILLTALNIFKPLHIDDPVYLKYGTEFVNHPFNPYQFSYGTPFLAPANNMLVPPVFPYWLGTGTLIFGDNLVLLKCWLFPFALLLAWAIAFLTARLAPSLRVPLFWLCMLLPSLLPGFNLMLEVPALALGLAALALIMRSLETGSWALTLSSGVLAGLAVQTKYTAAVPCAAIVLWCTLRGRPARGLVAAVLALSLVVGWEWLVAQAQGESHFLIHLRQRQGRFVQRCLYLVLPLLIHVAGMATATVLLALLALGWTRRGILIAGTALLSGFALLALVPSQGALIAGSDGKPLISPSNVIYGLMAVLVWSSFGLICCRLARREGDADDRVADWFLLGWLVLELGGYFVLSPYPAARRVVGLLLVFTLLVGRMAHLRGVTPRAAGWLAIYAIVPTSLIYTADLLDARSGKVAAYEAANSSYTPIEGGTYWYLGWWGFAYYADREGLQQLQLNRQMPQPGDLLAVHEPLLEILPRLPDMGLELLDTIVVGDGFPLKTVLGYYAGRTPLENQSSGRTRVLIYRVKGAK